ncbi:FAD-binding oxidoreductase [Aliishimia ponticola]|uniref:FAD-binding oxidoreductase n=1 Tax=Aliishimia ponticola TaxID=2499833 RepID=A0A4S4N9M6_9RHOB|nr:FAD-binding oxidoreductase [Aliishimia ponticola]THH35325.1 FAD-binding oxidoreductase [Aliishimia ponticola]
MRRIFPGYVYGDQPRDDCWWTTTCALPGTPVPAGDLRCDVAIIGAGFTGLNAALELAAAGVDVVVLDAKAPGWGASGRNGGFCCLGGSKLSDADLDRRFGKQARLEWRGAEQAAVAHVAGLLSDHQIDADTHSQGETLLAHKPSRMRGIEEDAASVEENYGVTADVHSRGDLAGRGLNAGFHGGITIPIGFGLNPRKYLAGLLRAVLAKGARVFSDAPVTGMEKVGTGWRLQTGAGTVMAEQALVATNGYSSEDIPPSLAGRYMPAQSSVVVTRPLTQDELARQGWTSRQMCYDSRALLHYFRLMPDNRMLFGMRGGLGASHSAENRARLRITRDFARMFPEWAGVELTHYWSGMVCLSAGLLPIVGPVAGRGGLWTALAFHGNGVAMGSYSGALAARAMLGNDQRPEVLQSAPSKFPLGRFRRAMMVPAYLGLMAADRWV